MNIYLLLAVGTLLLHLLWNLWVITGWLVTHNRPFLRWFHIVSVIYSVVVMPLSWRCPLTVAERHFERLAGQQPFKTPFVIHYLRMIVSPSLPKGFVIFSAEVVCAAILLHYAVRYRKREVAGW